MLKFQNSLIDRPDNLVALREITHYGAIVSPESAELYRRTEQGINIPMRNKKAADEFFKNIVRGTDFHKLFSVFLQNSYSNLLEYQTGTCFPGTNPTYKLIEGFPHMSNSWEGPQLKVPRKVSINDAVGFFVSSTDRESVHRLRGFGIPNHKIFSIREILPEYFRFLQSMNSKPSHHAIINLALRDMSLIARHNRFRETNSNVMVEFHNRI